MTDDDASKISHALLAMGRVVRNASYPLAFAFLGYGYVNNSTAFLALGAALLAARVGRTFETVSAFLWSRLTRLGRGEQVERRNHLGQLAERNETSDPSSGQREQHEVRDPRPTNKRGRHR